MNHKKVFHCSRTFYSPVRGRSSSVGLVTTRKLRAGSNTSRDKTLLFSVNTDRQWGTIILLFGGQSGRNVKLTARVQTKNKWSYTSISSYGSL